MTLRTAGLIAGVLGLVLLAVGFIASALKPAAEASPSAPVDASVVVVPPNVVALSPDAVLAVSGSGTLAVHTGRTQDVEAWLAGRGATTITGVSTWDALAVSTRPATVPESSPTSSPTSSATSSPAASPEPSPADSAAAVPDIWRDSTEQMERYSVKTADVPTGLTLVVEGVGDARIDTASLTIPRTIDDDWIVQTIWWGVGLSVVGLVALIALFVDLRPAQSRGEEWLAHRSGIGAGKEAPKPGSRRARRHEGAQMPVATIPVEPTPSGAMVQADEAATPDVPLVALATPASGATPTVREPDESQVASATFEPPADDEEDRS